MIRAVLLDLGGTLVDSGRGTELAVRELIRRFKRYGAELDEGRVLREWWEIWKARVYDPGLMVEKIRAMVAELLSRFGISSSHLDEAFDLFLSEEVKHTKPFPEVPQVLEELRKLGCRLAVISNCSSRWGNGVLDSTGLRGYFDLVLISDEIGVAKPDEMIFELALRSLRVGREEAIMVGDDPKTDVEGATRAGIRACLVDRTGKWAGKGSIECRLKDLMELLSMLKGAGESPSIT